MHKLNKDLITNQPRIYDCPRPIMALTGGIATGKSTVSRILIDQQVPLIDADQLVKKIYQKAESISFIKNLKSSLVSEGNINFPALRKLFFEDTIIKEQVEQYIYQMLPVEFNISYKQLNFSKYDFLIYDIPLLFEKKLTHFFDANVLVYASRELQQQRLISRDKISKVLANKILQQQIDIEEKKNLAMFIIKNMSDIKKLNNSVQDFLAQVTIST